MVNFFILSTFDKHDKMQLLAKFKKILYMGFRATLNFRKAKAVIKGVFKRSYCCYGNLLCQKTMTTCSPMIGQFFDTMIVASSDKEWL